MVDRFNMRPVLQACPFGVSLLYGPSGPAYYLARDLARVADRLASELPKGTQDTFVRYMMTQWNSAGETSPHASGLLGRRYNVQVKSVAQSSGELRPVMEVVTLSGGGQALSPAEEVAQSSDVHRLVARTLCQPVALAHAAILVPYPVESDGTMVVDLDALQRVISSATIALFGAKGESTQMTARMLAQGDHCFIMRADGVTDAMVAVGIHTFGRTLIDSQEVDGHVTAAMFNADTVDSYDVLTYRTPSRLDGQHCVQIRVRPTINGHEGAETMAFNVATQILLRLS